MFLKARDVGVAKLEAGSKGIAATFRGNAFRNPAGLVAWHGSKGGLVSLRPDHKLATVREMDVAARIRTARDMLWSLARIAGRRGRLGGGWRPNPSAWF